MPTPTWERLPAAKAAAVTEAAEAEFAAHGFSGASLNAICAKAGISKGSLFQYFTNKADLFAYLAELATIRIRRLMEEAAVPLPWDTDILGALDGLGAAWVGYFFHNPRDLAMVTAVNLEHEPHAVAAIRKAVNIHYVEVVRPIIDIGVATDQLSDDSLGRELVLATLLISLPHLAMAPHVEGLDANLGLFGADEAKAITISQRLIRHAFAPIVPVS